MIKVKVLYFIRRRNGRIKVLHGYGGLVSNFMALNYALMRNTPYTVVTIEGLSLTYNPATMTLKLINVNAGADEEYGMLIGKDGKAYSYTDYTLDIFSTTEAKYKDSTVEYTTAEPQKIYITRRVDNIKNTQITVKETGIVALMKYIEGGTEKSARVLIARDVPSDPITLNPGDGISVRWSMEIIPG